MGKIDASKYSLAYCEQLLRANPAGNARILRQLFHDRQKAERRLTYDRQIRDALMANQPTPMNAFDLANYLRKHGDQNASAPHMSAACRRLVKSGALRLASEHPDLYKCTYVVGNADAPEFMPSHDLEPEERTAQPSSGAEKKEVPPGPDVVTASGHWAKLMDRMIEQDLDVSVGYEIPATLAHASAGTAAQILRNSINGRREMRRFRWSVQVVGRKIFVTRMEKEPAMERLAESQQQMQQIRGPELMQKACDSGRAATVPTIVVVPDPPLEMTSEKVAANQTALDLRGQLEALRDKLQAEKAWVDARAEQLAGDLAAIDKTMEVMSRLSA